MSNMISHREAANITSENTWKPGTKNYDEELGSKNYERRKSGKGNRKHGK